MKKQLVGIVSVIHWCGLVVVQFKKKNKKMERKKMTDTEKAIEIIENYSPSRDEISWATMRDAIIIAIEALKEKAEHEKCNQWLDDIDNPLEPIKIRSALSSEIMKLEYRKEHNFQAISILDYTILAALAEALGKRENKNETI